MILLHHSFTFFFPRHAIVVVSSRAIVPVFVVCDMPKAEEAHPGSFSTVTTILWHKSLWIQEAWLRVQICFQAPHPHFGNAGLCADRPRYKYAGATCQILTTLALWLRSSVVSVLNSLTTIMRALPSSSGYLIFITLVPCELCL